MHSATRCCRRGAQDGTARQQSMMTMMSDAGCWWCDWRRRCACERGSKSRAEGERRPSISSIGSFSPTGSRLMSSRGVRRPQWPGSEANGCTWAGAGTGGWEALRTAVPRGVGPTGRGRRRVSGSACDAARCGAMRCHAMPRDAVRAALSEVPMMTTRSASGRSCSASSKKRWGSDSPAGRRPGLAPLARTASHGVAWHRMAQRSTAWHRMSWSMGTLGARQRTRCSACTGRHTSPRAPAPRPHAHAPMRPRSAARAHPITGPVAAATGPVAAASTWPVAVATRGPEEEAARACQPSGASLPAMMARRISSAGTVSPVSMHLPRARRSGRAHREGRCGAARGSEPPRHHTRGRAHALAPVEVAVRGDDQLCGHARRRLAEDSTA